MPPLPENVDYASGLADNCSLSGPSGHLALLAHIARNDSIRNWQQKEPEKQLESFTRRVADTAADRARRFSLRRGMHARRYHRESLVPAFALFFAGEFGSRLVVDFLFAYAFGIAFQYFTIVPMRQLGFAEGLRASVRADTISIITFEMGVRLDGPCPLCPVCFSPLAAERSRLMVHDAGRHDRRSSHRISGKRLADPQRMEGKNPHEGSSERQPPSRQHVA
jgi:hypothetical protein